MPYKMIKKGYPWQGGQERFIKEFFPLSPYQVNLGETESAFFCFCFLGVTSFAPRWFSCFSSGIHLL